MAVNTSFLNFLSPSSVYFCINIFAFIFRQCLKVVKVLSIEEHKVVYLIDKYRKNKRQRMARKPNTISVPRESLSFLLFILDTCGSPRRTKWLFMQMTARQGHHCAEAVAAHPVLVCRESSEVLLRASWREARKSLHTRALNTEYRWLVSEHRLNHPPLLFI